MNSLHIAGNLLKRIFSDRKGWFSYLVMPVFVMSLIVSFIGGDSTHVVKVGYANQDQGVFGEDVIGQVAQKEEYRFVKMDERELTEGIRSGKLSLGLVIPPDFTSKLLAGQTVPIRNYYLNISEASFGLEFSLKQSVGQLERTTQAVRAGGAAAEQIPALVEKVLAQQDKHQVKTTVTDTGKTVNNNLYLVIGFMLYFVMGSIVNSLALVLEDRSQMTMTRIYTAPVRSYEIALGNFLGSFAVGLLQILVAMVITKYIVGFDYGIGFVPMFVILAFFLLAAVGIGSAIGALVKNSSNIGQLNALVIVPTCMLGGCWWPLSIMPGFMQKIANFVPQTWAIDAVEQLAAGQSLMQIGLNLGILALFAVIFLGFGSAVLRPAEKAAA